ncbi:MULTISPECIES: YggS family pyridoxal phosphate-dependent enzyme [unclassified Aureispira]|uniref:YggS family pyridoxal phosphate-dependent enzyme n=1 Tax=unclassified Aureispira TaxID=2649989 RepID=UPI0006985E79|nr:MULTISPECIES: YggS family pyridoxal phosphate-dependent enzyme [unclassified Aureispira]WMX12572.1 YggS family pyridoxal phosphate-dependent enzyme [Aureispira sp. CCB-E]
MVNEENYKLVLKKVNDKAANLVAVSKTKPKEDIETMYNLGQRIFGENKVQELVEKQAALPKDIEWHLIGTLQRNKVKYIADFVSLIHSVDSFKLLKEINKQAQKVDRVIDCLLQFHIAEEATKFGLSYEEGVELLSSKVYKEMQHIRIVGVMGMATFTDDTTKVAREFECLRQYFEKYKQEFFADNESFKEVSMGMSGDYEIALDKGSTLVRVGSLLFGARVYP